MWKNPLEGGSKPLFFGGHCFYVRKCVGGEQDSQDFWDRSLGGVKLPETAVEHSLYVEVVAKGPRVGEKCSKSHAKKYARARHLQDSVEIGDLLLCPNDSIGIKRSDVCDELGRRLKYEYFIEESIPLGKHSGDKLEDLIPWGDRILAQMIVEESCGGIIYVDPELKAYKAKVLALGTGSFDGTGQVREWDVAVGDTIIVMKRSGISIGADFGDNNLKIFREIEVLGVEAEED